MGCTVKNGYKLAEWVNPLAFAAELTDRLTAEYQQSACKIIATRACEMLCAAETQGQILPVDLVAEAFKTFTQTSSPGSDNYRTQIWFGYDPITSQKVMLFNGPAAVEAKFSSLNEVNSYSYLDGEPPHGIKPDEWSTRSEVWHRVIPTSGVYGEQMTLWTMDPLSRIVNGHNVDAHTQIDQVMPTVTERARKLVIERLPSKLTSTGASLPEVFKAIRTAEAISQTNALDQAIELVSTLMAPSTAKTLMTSDVGQVFANIDRIDRLLMRIADRHKRTTSA